MEIGLFFDILNKIAMFFVGLLFKKVSNKFKYRKATKFWNTFIKSNNLLAIIGKFNYFGNFEKSGLMGVGDAMALSELQFYFKKIGLEEFLYDYADTPKDNRGKSIILIGGPDVNEQSQYINSQLTSIRFIQESFGIIDSKTGSIYFPKNDENKDFGIIVRIQNPSDIQYPLLFIAGCFGYGTWAAIRYTMTDEFLNNEIVKSGKNFECLIEVDILQNRPHVIKTIVEPRIFVG